jgi:hypothetical protein
MTSFLAPILLEILIMTDFMRALNRHVERVFNPSSKVDARSSPISTRRRLFSIVSRVEGDAPFHI